MLKKITSSLLFHFNKFRRRIFKNEHSDLKFIIQNLNINIETIFDVGANVGDTIKKFKSLFPNSQIHAFEPNPTIFEKLKQNTSHLDKLNLNNVGVGDKNGILKLNRHINSGATSFKNPNTITNPTYSQKIIDQIDVPVITLSEYIESNKIVDIDLLKIDVEGFEFEVLQGFSVDQLCKKTKVIFIESNLIEKMLNQALIEEIIAFLRKNNFTLYNIYTQQESTNRQLFIVNLLFINNSIIKI